MKISRIHRVFPNLWLSTLTSLFTVIDADAVAKRLQAKAEHTRPKGGGNELT